MPPRARGWGWRESVSIKRALTKLDDERRPRAMSSGRMPSSSGSHRSVRLTVRNNRNASPSSCAAARWPGVAPRESRAAVEAPARSSWRTHCTRRSCNFVQRRHSQPFVPSPSRSVARCSGVHPTKSPASEGHPQRSSAANAAGCEWLAATCAAVQPNLVLAAMSAPARRRARRQPTDPERAA